MKFTKEVLNNYKSTDFGEFAICNLYKVFDKEILVGQFVCSTKIAYILTENDSIRIDIEKHFIKKSKYKIIDLKNNTQIGFYDMPVWRTNWKEVGSLTLNQETYFCNRQRPETKYNIFKKATWGHYKIIISNHLTAISINLKVDTEWISQSNVEFSNAQGKIETDNATNILTMVSLFLIERMLHNVDNDAL